MSVGFDLFSLPEPPSATVLIRGVPVVVRAISYSTLKLIARAYPAPTPPLMKDPAKGSLAPLVPNFEDPEYRKELGRWSGETGIIELACAINLRVNVPDEPGNDPVSPGYCKAALVAMRETLAQEELEALRTAYDGLFKPVAEQEKN